MKNLITIIFVLICNASLSQINIKLPDIDGYKTLKADLHIHTVFSDGLVWPTVRVAEAKKEGIDVISLTEHIEYHPFSDNVKSDNNQSYEIARSLAEKNGIILIRGGEITRSMPPGHSNALFLQDCNKLATENYMDAYKEAARQGAFIFWNHPCWKKQQPDTVVWWKEHEELYEKKLLHGIEVVNRDDYCKEAHRWCIEKNLTFLANSDIHNPVCMEYNDCNNKHRPLTLLFVKEKSIEGCSEALFERRTLILHNYKLYGFRDLLTTFIKSCLIIEKAEKINKKQVLLTIKNTSSIPFILGINNSNESQNSDYEISLNEGENSFILNIAQQHDIKTLSLCFTIKNAFAEPEKALEVCFENIELKK